MKSVTHKEKDLRNHEENVKSKTETWQNWNPMSAKRLARTSNLNRNNTLQYRIRKRHYFRPIPIAIIPFIENSYKSQGKLCFEKKTWITSQPMIQLSPFLPCLCLPVQPAEATWPGRVVDLAWVLWGKGRLQSCTSTSAPQITGWFQPIYVRNFPRTQEDADACFKSCQGSRNSDRPLILLR